MKYAKIPIAILLAMAFVGCASFVNTSQKSLYAAASLADGGMKAYAVYWKDKTNKSGDTPSLEQQRSNVMAISYKVGTSLKLAQKTLDDYAGKVGTNTATKEVVQALVQTAVQDAGAIAGEISVITGDPNWVAH